MYFLNTASVGSIVTGINGSSGNLRSSAASMMTFCKEAKSAHCQALPGSSIGMGGTGTASARKPY